MLKTSMITLTVAFALASGSAMAKTPMVGGAKMFPSKTIVQNASKAKNLTTLVAAVAAAGLVDTLSSPGPFTVFAPTNAAFAKLPAGTVETLLKPENKATLTKILTCHVVSGKVMASAVIKLVKAGGGKATVKTVGGCDLDLQLGGGKVHITDETGSTAQVTQADVVQSNGVVHVINKVLLPK
jgi:uncharacterized surface protein with fasciclin (FAS1) repeats